MVRAKDYRPGHHQRQTGQRNRYVLAFARSDHATWADSRCLVSCGPMKGYKPTVEHTGSGDGVGHGVQTRGTAGDHDEGSVKDDAAERLRIKQ